MTEPEHVEALQDLDAEEAVLGAVLSGGAVGNSEPVVAALRASGLQPSEFYRPSHGTMLATIYRMDEAGETVDAVTFTAALDAAGKLEEIGGRARVYELAVLSPATANVAAWARRVRMVAEQREERAVGQAIAEAARNGGVAAHPELAERVRRVLDGRATIRKLEGMTHAEALAAEIPPARELVEGVVDVGTVGGIVGLPYARKSWVAQELGRKVAAGEGLFLGKYPVLVGGPVVYCWQDDSTPKMLERVQMRPDDSAGLPIRWFLNEGIRLPDDLPALREIVLRDQAVLVVLDSLYNFLPATLKLKDEEVAPVIAALKSELCDRTGATVATVDHAPWPSENNRGQRRAYGSVFKTAAVRWTIHLETDGKDDTRLHVEARGNNVAGFPRTPAYWDEEEREVRLLEPERLNEEELDALVLAWVGDHPGEATTKVAAGVGKRRENVAESLERLGTAWKVECKTSRELGRRGTGHFWFPFDHAGSKPSAEDGTAWDGLPGLSPSEASRPTRPTPVGGTASRRDGLKEAPDAEDAADEPTRAHVRRHG